MILNYKMGVAASALALGAVTIVLAVDVQAQAFSGKPVRMIVGFPPGGSNDIVARIVGPKLGELIGAQVVI